MLNFKNVLAHEQIVHQELERSICPSCCKRSAKHRLSEHEECSEDLMNFALEIFDRKDTKVFIEKWINSINNDDIITIIDGIPIFKTDVVSLCAEQWMSAGTVAIGIKSVIQEKEIKVEAIGPELMITYFLLPEKMEPSERAIKAGCLFDGEFLENV